MNTMIDELIIEMRFRELTSAPAQLRAALRRDALLAQLRSPEGAADAPTR